MPRLTIAAARELIAAALVRCKTSEPNARSVAHALVAAESDGLKGHGFSRVSTYAGQAKIGKVDGFAVPSVTQPRPALVLIDAAHGFAYPALERAVALLPAITKAQGVAAAAITRSHHCGVAGHPLEQLAAQGLVAMLFANTPGAIAPWGGSKALYGTNPVAFAAPLPDRAPLVIDLSLSKVARGNILAAKQKGERIPDGWALDPQGKPTTDPAEALAGTMLPLGDAKGTMLALMVELLAAGLTGAHFAADAPSFLDMQGGPPGTGQLIIAFDPSASGGANWLARFGSLADSIEAQPPARLPGTRRLASRDKAERDGLEIADALLAEISAL